MSSVTPRWRKVGRRPLTRGEDRYSDWNCRRRYIADPVCNPATPRWPIGLRASGSLPCGKGLPKMAGYSSDFRQCPWSVALFRLVFRSWECTGQRLVGPQACRALKVAAKIGKAMPCFKINGISSERSRPRRREPYGTMHDDRGAVIASRCSAARLRNSDDLKCRPRNPQPAIHCEEVAGASPVGPLGEGFRLTFQSSEEGRPLCRSRPASLCQKLTPKDAP